MHRLNIFLRWPICRFAILLLTLSINAGCREHVDDIQYMIRHPEATEAALIACQNKARQSSTIMTQCQSIENIAMRFALSIEAEYENAQKFGMNILQTQMATDQARRRLDILSSHHPTQKELTQAKTEYQEYRTQVYIMLAAIRAESPI